MKVIPKFKVDDRVKVDISKNVETKYVKRYANETGVISKVMETEYDYEVALDIGENLYFYEYELVLQVPEMSGDAVQEWLCSK